MLKVFFCVIMTYSLKALEDKGKKFDYCKHKVIRERNEVYDMFDINCNFFYCA